MTEQIIHSVLLALHNIALVGCAAAPFYNRALVLKRGQYGPKLHYELDKVVEDTLQGNAPYCITFIITLIITGIAMPFNYYLFHGTIKQTNLVSVTALTVKLIAVAGMVVIMLRIFYRINPRLRELFGKFSQTAKPDESNEKEFFTLWAKRKALCEICLVFAILVLVASAFLGFSV
jgi:putative copper export protein